MVFYFACNLNVFSPVGIKLNAKAIIFDSFFLQLEKDLYID